MSPSDECRGASAHGEERVSRVRGWEGEMDKVAIYILPPCATRYNRAGGIKRITKLGVFRACAGHHLEPVKGTGPLVPSNLAFRKSKTSATATATPGSTTRSRRRASVAPYTAPVAPSASRYAVRCH